MRAVSIALGFLHVVAWATYVGGAVAMEVLWRPAQRYIPASQVNVVCRRMGRRYRWMALACLALIAVTGAGLLAAAPADTRPPITAASPYGRTLLVLSFCWAALVGLVATMATVAHPALHQRTPAALDPDEIAAARDRVRRAIRRMDVLLRCELGLALVAAFLGVSLHFGGLL